MHTTVAQSILCMIFSMYVAAIQCLDYNGQDPKKYNLQSMYLTHL